MPHPWARAAAEEVIRKVHSYMACHPESELHRQGKMFGVLVVRHGEEYGYLKAFSSLLDGRHEMAGYVPPVFDFAVENGYFRQEEAKISAMTERPEERKERSRMLQRWLFAQYKMLAADGESRDLLDIFQHEKPILSAEDYFSGNRKEAEHLPPAGAGECCGPKLLQYAFAMGYVPLAMAEFWVGKADPRELRQEGCFYGACQGKCKPILRHMLRGIAMEEPIPEIDYSALQKQIRILYQDDYVLVALKPAGLLTVPGKEEQMDLETSLRLRTGIESQRTVHRLDRDTSGIVVMAKTEAIYVTLQRSFATRQVSKRYEAVCMTGEKPIPDQGVVDLPLLPNPLDRPRQMVDYQYGKAAKTRYEVVKRWEDGRVGLNLYPETGRTHQLRVHCAHQDGLDAAIVGDPLYGTAADRLYLHAADICFSHPVTGARMHFSVKSSWF